MVLKRHQSVFLAVAIAAVCLMTFQSRFGRLHPFWFVSSAIDRANSSIVYLREGVRTFRRVAVLNETELAELREQNRDLRKRMHDHDTLLRENERLREALDFTDRAAGIVAVAKVISKGGDILSNIIVINKGEKHGIRKDMVAIVPEGLVGKVLSADDSYSRVMLLDDSRLSAAARLSDTRAEAVYTGSGNRGGVLKYLRVDAPVAPGTDVLTSGLDALYPPDITIGKVDSVATDKGELFHRIRVRPSVDLGRIEEVFIVAR